MYFIYIVDVACVLAPIYDTRSDPADDPPWAEATDDKVEEVVGRRTHMHCLYLMSKDWRRERTEEERADK